MPVSPEALIEIPPQSGTAFRLARGEVLRIIDPLGAQVADVVAFVEADPREALSNGRTFDYNERLRLTTGATLYSNRSRPLLEIVRDDVGVHDFLLTPCSRDTWRLCYDDPHDERPGCFGNLADALASYGIAPDAIPTTFNAFMNVRIDPNGRIAVLPPVSRAGDAIELRASLDLIVGLTACSAAHSNGGRMKPIRYEIVGGGATVTREA